MYGIALITGSLRTAWCLWGVVELGRHLLKVLHLANVSLSLLSVFV